MDKKSSFTTKEGQLRVATKMKVRKRSPVIVIDLLLHMNTSVLSFSDLWIPGHQPLRVSAAVLQHRHCNHEQDGHRHAGGRV